MANQNIRTSLEVILYFPLGSEVGTLYHFVVKPETVYEEVWKYWFSIYCKMSHETAQTPEYLIGTWCDLLGSVPDETYRALNREINPLEPDQVNRAIVLLKVAIKYVQESQVGYKRSIWSHSMEDI